MSDRYRQSEELLARALRTIPLGSQTFSKSKNTPFNGLSFKGKNMLTFSGSEIYRDAMFPSERYTINE